MKNPGGTPPLKFRDPGDPEPCIRFKDPGKSGVVVPD